MLKDYVLESSDTTRHIECLPEECCHLLADRASKKMSPGLMVYYYPHAIMTSGSIK